MTVKSVAIAVIFLIIGYGVSFLLPPSDFINADSLEDSISSNVSANPGEIVQKRDLALFEGENETPLTDGRDSKKEQEPTVPEFHLQDHDFTLAPGDPEMYGFQVDFTMNAGEAAQVKNQLASKFETSSVVRFFQPNGLSGFRVLTGLFLDLDSARLELEKTRGAFPSHSFRVVNLPDCVVNGPEDEFGYKCGPPPEPVEED